MKIQCIGMLAVLLLAHLTLAQTTQPATQPIAPPPAGAVVLFDGTAAALDLWTYRDGTPAGWGVADGEMTSRHMDIVTKQKFKDFQLHVEWCEPKLPDNVKGQARGNSGVYLQGRYEIQVLDSYGLDAKDDDCGAIYKQKAPDVNACLPPEQWQTYDITFKAARFDADGKKTAGARVTILQNGKKIQDDVEIKDVTGGHLSTESAEPGPILLQYHHNSIRFRNVWIMPAAENQ
jgi:Domain of Unknown Function (DUF1080)